MITHYLTVAIRNLLKYKSQSIVSILGLAIGFVCFALSAFWIEYESTYDAHRKDSGRIYVVQVNDAYETGRIRSHIPYSFGEYLKEHYPEVEESYIGRTTSSNISGKDWSQEAYFASADSAWIDFLGIRILKGNRNFTIPYSREIAITERKAKEWFGNNNPIGKNIKENGDTKTICAIISADNAHTNFPVDIVGYEGASKDWHNCYYHVLIKLQPGTDAQEMEAKINANLPKEMKVDKRNRPTGINHAYLLPLSDLRHDRNFRRDNGIAYDYILYFSITGLLVILCAMVNYLSLFINRMRIRQREMGLRMVHGASYHSLVTLLTTEFLMMLVCAIFIGFILIEIFFPPFKALTETDASRLIVYKESFLFIALVSLIMVSAIIGLLYLLLHRSLHRALHPDASRRAGLWLRKGSIVVQLFISLTFIGCTLLMNRQLEYLRHREMGMNIDNMGVFSIYGQYLDREAWQKKIESLPMVTEALAPNYHAIVSQGSFASDKWNNWEGIDTPLENFIPVHIFLGDETLFRFYGITLLAGEHLNESSGLDQIIINESLARQMGWTPEAAIGKHVIKNNKASFTITGVVKDCHYVAPTQAVPAMAFIARDPSEWAERNNGVLFKYQPGTWEKCRNELLKYFQEEGMVETTLTLKSEEETYNIYLQSENMLMRLLGFASVVCMLTAIFGIYSLVTLTCEQRRKEIAIRKVNGATVKDILQMFFREYLIMLTLAAIVAFPITYTIIKRWIEGYTRQMDISIWPFVIVFFILLGVIIISISWRVWKASNENPADVIKSE